jgi:hypothetical protein
MVNPNSDKKEVSKEKIDSNERVEPKFSDLSTGFEFPIAKTVKQNIGIIGVGVATSASVLPFIDITGISASCMILMLVVLNARNNANVYLKMMTEMLPILETIHNNITYIVTLSRYINLNIDATMVDKIYSGIVSIYIQLLLNMRKEEYNIFKYEMKKAGISNLYLFMEKKISVDEFEKNIESVENAEPNTEVVGGELAMKSTFQSVKKIAEKAVSPVMNTVLNVSEKYSEDSVTPSKVIEEIIRNRDYEEGNKVYGFAKGVYRGIKRLNVTLETKYLLTNKLIFINTYLTNILIDVLRQVEIIKSNPDSLEKYNEAIQLIAKKEMDIPEISKIVGYFKNKSKGVTPSSDQMKALEGVKETVASALSEAASEVSAKESEVLPTESQSRFNSKFDSQKSLLTDTTVVNPATATPTTPATPAPRKKWFGLFGGGKSKKNRKQMRKQMRKQTRKHK